MFALRWPPTDDDEDEDEDASDEDASDEDPLSTHMFFSRAKDLLLAMALEENEAREIQDRANKRRRPQKRGSGRYAFEDPETGEIPSGVKAHEYPIHKDWLTYMRLHDLSGMDPELKKKWGTWFRQKFRIPHSMFLDILDRARACAGPETWPDERAAHKRKPKPLGLKILGVLRVLALGIPMEGLTEVGLSKSVMVKFFNRFVPWFVQTYYEVEVHPPRTAQELRESERVFARCGFPGCILSMDGVHLAWDRAPFKRRHNYTGKEGFPTVAFNVCVSHAKLIYSVTDGQYGAMNDKMMVRYDNMIDRLGTDEFFKDFEFDVMVDDDGAEHQVVKTLQGAWAMCDGGYHRWPHTICGVKHACEKWEALFSERVESVRKDVECVFGIMKKRWRMLRVPFLVETRTQITDVFKMCACLHNMLMRHDGRDDMGAEEDDWKAADLASDEWRTHVERVQRTRRNAHGDADMFDEDATAVGPAEPLDQLVDQMETHVAFHNRRNELIQNYKWMAQGCGEKIGLPGGIQWLEPASSARPRVS